MPRRRRRNVTRVVLSAVLVLVVLVVAAVAAALLLVDPNGFKPEIAAAVRRATGRELDLRGPIRLGLGLPPRLVVNDVTFANPPGGSRPEMVAVKRLEARVALLPLLSGEVDLVRLDIEGPDVLLETDAAGHGNWQMTPQEAAPPAAPASASAPPRRGRFAIGSVRVRQGRLTWRDAASGRSFVVAVPRLDAEQVGAAGVVVSGDIVAAGHTLVLTGELGPLARLLEPAATPPWPLQLVLQGEGARLAVRGTIDRPQQAAGYALQVDAAATDLAPFAALLPAPLPKLRDLSLSARVKDTGHALSDVTAVTAHVAGLELGKVAISRADLTAPGLAEPVHADLDGTLSGAPLHLTATLGSLAALIPQARAPGPVPVEVAATAAGAQLSAKGTLADPARLAGADIAVAVRIADLATLAPVAGRPLPDWKAVALDVRLGGDLLGDGDLALHGVALTTPPVQLTADLVLHRAPRPALRGSISASRVDLDPLLAALAAPPPPAAPAAPPRPAAKPARLFPDTPIDLAPLQEADADLQVAAAAVTGGGATYSDLAFHLVLANGRLALDPLSATAPGGRIEGRFSVDAEAPTPPVALALHAPAVALPPLAAALGAPDAATGTAFIDADLHGAGRSPHAIAATLDGHLGIALQDAELDNAVLASTLAGVLRAAKIPESVLGGAGRTRVRCAALRLNIRNGTASVAALALDSGRVLLQGSGAIELGPETLALRPTLRVGPVSVPVRIGGTLLEPRPTLDSAAAGRTALLGALGDRGGGDACPAALAAARGEPVAAAPAAAPAQPGKPGKPAGKPPKAVDVLRGLLPR